MTIVGEKEKEESDTNREFRIASCAIDDLHIQARRIIEFHDVRDFRFRC